MPDEERTGYGHFEPDRHDQNGATEEGPGRDEDEAAEEARRRNEGRRSDTGPDGPLCDICGHPMLDKHCKLICLNCGFRRDCSDP